MTTTAPGSPPPTRRNPVSRFFCWLFSWRGLRRVVIILAWTATLIALVYGEENWRSRHAWEQYRSAAEARGEHLDWKYFIPKPIPDDRNFAMYGSLPKALFNANGEQRLYFKDNFQRAGHPASSPNSYYGHFHFTDLAAWEKALTAASAPGASDPGPQFEVTADPDPASRAAAAPGILLLLEDSQPLMEELRAASSRPGARYPIEYIENPAAIALPHYTQLQSICRRLRLRACAELALGRNDEAAKDLKLGFYLADSIRNENFLIALLVRNSLLIDQKQIIWEGLAQHRWSDSQLQEIQQELLSQNFVGEGWRDLGADQACMVAVFQYYGYIAKKGFGEMLDDIERFTGESPDQKGKRDRILLNLMPRGWYHLEQLDFCMHFQARFQSVFDPDAKRIFPLRLESNIRAEPPPPVGEVQALMQHRYAWKMLAPFDTFIVSKFAMAQCIADQAAIACALERYRLAKGEYPAQLDALAPAFIPALPHDVLTGESYIYRLDAKDVYTLYSVGWDLKDDGGKPGAKPYGLDGDWVWQ